MMIKWTKLASSIGPIPTLLHINDKENNRFIKYSDGTADDFFDTSRDARDLGHKNFAIHIIVAPQGKTTDENFKRIQEIIEEEYPDFKDQLILRVRHGKERADGKDNDVHEHLFYPAFSYKTGKAVDDKFFKLRNEKISRLCELEFDHKTILGRGNSAVIKHLRKEHKHKEADALEAACIDKGPRPKAAFKHSQQKKLEKDNIMISKEKALIKNQWNNAPKNKRFSLSHEGIEIKPGKKKGVWTVYKNGVFIGALDRLVGEKRKVVNDIMLLPNEQPKPTYSLKPSIKAANENDKTVVIPSEPFPNILTSPFASVRFVVRMLSIGLAKLFFKTSAKHSDQIECKKKETTLPPIQTEVPESEADKPDDQTQEHDPAAIKRRVFQEYIKSKKLKEKEAARKKAQEEAEENSQDYTPENDETPSSPAPKF